MGEILRSAVGTWLVAFPAGLLAIVVGLPLLSKVLMAVTWWIELIGGQG
jgi:hypothetical protein